MRRSTMVIFSALLILLTCHLPATTFAQALKLYWADEFAGRIYKSDPDGANLETLITGDLLNSEEIVLGADKIYWSDAERGIIQRANTDGTDLETVVQTPEPGALGLDVTSGKLYWVDNTLGEIRRANLDGTSGESVQSLTQQGTSLTVDESGQFIIWGEYDLTFTGAFLYRRPIAGSDPQQLFVFQGAEKVRGLAAEEGGGWIYFGLGNELRRYLAAGVPVEVLYEAGDNITGVALDLAGGKIYWSDDGNWDVTRSDLDGGNVEVLETFARKTDGIAVDPVNAKLFWNEERYIVRSELDGTGQVKILSRPSFFAVGFHDSIDRIYYSDLNKLITYYAGSDGTGQTTFWPGNGVASGGALAIQVDHVANKVYWLDGGDRWLRKASPDGSNIEDLFHLSGDAYDMTLDIPGDRVYWCGRSTGSIYRRNLDGSGVTETLYSGLNLPKGLTLDYTGGRVIWGEDDQIAHGPIDGGGAVTVVFTDPFAVIGIEWDEADTRLYWADQLNSRVRRAKFNSNSGGWLPPETIFSMGLEHWPGRLALQYTVSSDVEDVVAARPQDHFAAPNPFNPTTTIYFNMAHAGPLNFRIYDVHGRLVRELLRDIWMPSGPGQMEWDGKGDTGQSVASGVYMYKIQAGVDRMMGKLVMLK